ncbi:putative Cytochrome P450 [Seiridium cardinale]
MFVLIVTSGLLAVFFIWTIAWTGPQLPKGLALLGAKEGDWFPYWQATWRNTLNMQAAVMEAYTRYKDNAVLMPLIGLGSATFVMLPASDTTFVVEQPPSVLNLRQVIVDGLQYRYTLSDNYVLKHPLDEGKLITQTLTNQVGRFLAELADETIVGFDQQWGIDTTEFHEVSLWDTVGRVIGSVTNRAFVGLPRCRDRALLDAGTAFAWSLPITATLLSRVWEPLRPIVAPFMTLQNRFFERRFAEALLPEIKSRMNGQVRRDDFLQWSIDQARESSDPKTYTPKALATRILLMNMVSIHTSSLTFVNVILDLLSSDPGVIVELRDEVATVLEENDSIWSKRSLAKMIKLDSVFRESARLNTSVAVGLRRKVVAKEGITTPSGVHLPFGNYCAVPNLAVLSDSSVYPEPESFKPWRFAEIRHDIDTGDRPKDHVTSARLTFPATSNDYLTWGNGRQACPGRFFATTELKLMLAYTILHYDFEMLPKRPVGTWVGIIRTPDMNVKIRVRRNKMPLATFSPLSFEDD